MVFPVRIIQQNTELRCVGKTQIFC